MKTIIKFLLIAIITFTISCNEDDTILFNPENTELSNTLLGFEGQSANLEIFINDVGSVDVTVNISTVSPQDRTFNLRVGDATTADPIYFSLPESITVPANEFSATFTIDGVDPLGEMIDPQVIIVEFDDPDNAITIESFTINLFIICPVDETLFLGDYLVEQITPTIFGYDTFDPDGGGVILTLANPTDADSGAEIVGSTSRVFSAFYIAVLGFDNETEYQINYVCEQVVFATNQATGLACGGNAVLLGSSTAENGAYDSFDDSNFVLIFQDDVNDSCGQGGPNVTLNWSIQ